MTDALCTIMVRAFVVAMLVAGCAPPQAATRPFTPKQEEASVKNKENENEKENEEDADDTAPSSASADAKDLFAETSTVTPPTASAESHHLTSISGNACLDCHGDGPKDGLVETVLSRMAPRFLFGGSASAPGIEIRVVDATGKVQGSAVTDADGNFWFKGPASIAPGSAGARDKSRTRQMQAPLTNGNCNSAGCHAGTPISL